VTADQYRKKKLFMDLLKKSLNLKTNRDLETKKRIYGALLDKYNNRQSKSFNIYSNFLIKRTLNAWTRKTTERLITAQKLLIASNYHRSESLKTSLYKLIKHTIKKQTSNQMKMNLKIHRNHNILKYFFKQWKGSKEHKLQIQNNLKKSETWNEIFVMKLMFEQWQRTIIKKKQTHLKTDLAKISYDTKLLQATFTSLYEFTKTETKKRRVYFEFQTKRVLKIKSVYYEKWLKRALKLSMMKLDSRLFEEHGQRGVMEKVIYTLLVTCRFCLVMPFYTLCYCYLVAHRHSHLCFTCYRKKASGRQSTIDYC
jgi:hypothetical protein